MTHIHRISIVCCLALFAWTTAAQDASSQMKGLLIDASELQNQQAESLEQLGMKQMVIAIEASPTPSQTQALERLEKSGLDIWYWIEIARDEKMATEHPEWMASIQGHPEWRRFHPDFPKEKENEVVKVYPWVPVFYEGAFDAHLKKVNNLLEQWPTSKGIFLNDLQGAPTACGCGHTLCRWTTDYGPKKSAKNMGHTAPAQFVKRVQETHPDLECIPVWATECEAHDKDGMCAGVGCYNGACWREWSKQLEPLAKTMPHLGVLLTYKELERDLPIYKEPAGWINKAIGAFDTESTRFQHPSVKPNRLVGILQGWDTSTEEIKAQIRQTEKSNTHGYILSNINISTQWEPRIFHMKVAQ